jgi:hypothetical protein
MLGEMRDRAVPAGVLPAQDEQVPQYHGMSQYPQSPQWHVPHVSHEGAELPLAQ